MDESDKLFKNMRSVIMNITSSRGPCTPKQVETKYKEIFDETTDDLKKCGFNSFAEVLSEMKRLNIVAEQENLYKLTNTQGIANTIRNVQASLPNRKASSYNKLSSLPGRESQIKNFRPPVGSHAAPFPPKRQGPPVALQMEPYIPKRQEKSRFTAPTIVRSVPPPPGNFAPVPQNYNYKETPSPSSPSPNVKMGAPPGLVGVAGTTFIYEKRMIAMLKECFPYGLTIIDVIGKIDVSSISLKLGHLEIKDVLVHSEHVFYNPSEDLYYGRPIIEDNEHSIDLIQKFVYEMLNELKRPMHLDELSKRLNVVSRQYNDPKMTIFEALIDSSDIDYRGKSPDVLYFLRPPQELTKSVSYTSISKALERMDLADENLGPPFSSNQVPSSDNLLQDWTDVSITDFRDFTCFSVRLALNERCFQQMKAELSKYCESFTNSNFSHLRVGDAIAVKNDGEWLRAEVLYGGDAKMILLRTIDVGYCFYENLPSKNVIFLPPQFRMPAFAFYCSLDIDGCDGDELKYFEEEVRNNVDVRVMSISQLAERAHSVKLLLNKNNTVLPDDFLYIKTKF